MARRTNVTADRYGDSSLPHYGNNYRRDHTVDKGSQIMDMSDDDFRDSEDNLRKRKLELMRPIEQQIMMTDDTNEVLLLAAAMSERAYSIFKNQYGRDGAIRLTNTMIEIVDDRDRDYD